MGLTKNLIVAGLALLLASLGQVAAAIGDPGGAAVRPDIGSTGDDPSATACMGAQCSLEDLKSATRAIAMSAGVKPAAALDAPSMLPESSHKTVGSVSTFSPGTNQNSDVEPVLFAVILPHSERSQLCIEEGNLLGMQPNCKPPRPDSGPELRRYDCEHDDPRLG